LLAEQLVQLLVAVLAAPTVQPWELQWAWQLVLWKVRGLEPLTAMQKALL